ncbi:MAG: hypothetical protein ABIE94_03240 [archaeon]
MTIKIGIDAKEIHIEFIDMYKKQKQFRSMVGIAVVTNEYDNLKKQYEKILQSTLKNNGIKSKRKVLSSFELLDLTDGDTKLHEEIYEKICPYLYKLNIIYTSFNTKRIPLIKTFGLIGVRNQKLDEFYDSHLVNAFPHICVWSIFDYIRDTKAEVLCDGFFSYTTDAWKIIKDYDKFNILYNGDKTNFLISLADIIVVVLQKRLENNKRSLYPPNIYHALKCKSKSHSPAIHIKIINNRHYPKITQLDKKGFPARKYIKHPTYFIMKPKGGSISTDFILSGLPKLMNEISDVGGCVTAFSERIHRNMVKEKDVFIYLDKTGETDIKTLKKLYFDNLISKDIKEYKK